MQVSTVGRTYMLRQACTPLTGRPMATQCRGKANYLQLERFDHGSKYIKGTRQCYDNKRGRTCYDEKGLTRELGNATMKGGRCSSREGTFHLGWDVPTRVGRFILSGTRHLEWDVPPQVGCSTSSGWDYYPQHVGCESGSSGRGYDKYPAR
jgi:hypothetical protein